MTTQSVRIYITEWIILIQLTKSTLISIHQNHFEDEKEHGMQIWYSPNDNKSPILANSILNITKEFLQPDNKRLNKKATVHIIYCIKQKVPSVMVECGFYE